ncbi:MAG: sigma-70 family RNA polymerase sigma factor [Clostridia bacterium]
MPIAVQNAIMKAWRKRGGLREPSKFKSWMIRIVINESKPIARRPKSLPLEEEIVADQFGYEVKIDVANAVMNLSEKYRLPIMMYYFEDMPVTEIAEALGLPKGTIVSQLSRAKQKYMK